MFYYNPRDCWLEPFWIDPENDIQNPKCALTYQNYLQLCSFQNHAEKSLNSGGRTLLASSEPFQLLRKKRRRT